MSDMKFVGPGGEPVDNLTSVVLLNNTAKTIDITVPAGKKWMFDFITLGNPDDVLRNVNVLLFKEAAKTNTYGFMRSGNIAAGVNVNIGIFIPSTGETRLTLHSSMRVVYPAGVTWNFIWSAGGASAGGTQADGLIVYVEEYPASMIDKAILTEAEKAEIPNIDWAFNPLKYPSHAKPLIAKSLAGWKQVPGNKNAWEDFQDPEVLEEP